MDAIQRLRAKAQANGKLETTKQQKVTVKQDQAARRSSRSSRHRLKSSMCPTTIRPSSMAWPYPAYPPYYFPPPAGWVVGGAIATGLAWGAAYAIGREIWDDFDWRHGNIDIDIDRNVNIDADRNFNKWEHNSYHRRGVAYNNADVKNKFNKANINAGDRKLDYRGHSGEQVLKPGNKPGGRPSQARRRQSPDLGGKGELPAAARYGRDRERIEGASRQGGKPAAQAGRQEARPGGGKPKGKGPAGGNAFDPGDGPKAKDFAKRGQASLGNRGQADFKRPSGGGSKSFKGGRGRVAAARAWEAVARGGGHVSRGGGGRGGGGGAAAAAAGGVPTSASSTTSFSCSSSATVSSSIDSATRAAIARSMSA